MKHDSNRAGNTLGSVALTFLAALTLSACSRPGEARAPFPRPEASNLALAEEGAPSRSAVFAGGCFWCTEAVFEEVDGRAQEVDLGLRRRHGRERPTTSPGQPPGRTDHAEVIRGATSIRHVLGLTGRSSRSSSRVAHNPTQLNYQWTGSRFASTAPRSSTRTEAQKVRGGGVHTTESGSRPGSTTDPIVTTLEPLEAFHPAEDYHQDFVRRNPDHDYVKLYARPKIRKVRRHFPDLVSGSR